MPRVIGFDGLRLDGEPPSHQALARDGTDLFGNLDVVAEAFRSWLEPQTDSLHMLIGHQQGQAGWRIFGKPHDLDILRTKFVGELLSELVR